MTKLIQGKIEKIVSKEIPPDNYENTFRISVKVCENWIGLGSKKKAGLSIQKGKEWIVLNEGDEVVITAEENGKYLNAKVSDVKLLKKGSDPVSSAVPGSPLPQKLTASTYTDRDAEIKAGMFFNKAVDVAIAKHGEKVSKAAVVQAYQMLEQAYAECRSDKSVPEPRDVAPDEEQQEQADFDDNLPF